MAVENCLNLQHEVRNSLLVIVGKIKRKYGQGAVHLIEKELCRIEQAMDNCWKQAQGGNNDQN